MRSAAELSPADWPRVVYGVRWDGRGRGLVFAAGLLAALFCSLLLASAALARDAKVPVVVVGKGSAAAVKANGGKVTHRVRLIDGVIAKVPSRSVGALRRSRGVRSVVVDRAFKTRSEGSDDDALLGETGAAADNTPADATTLREVRTAIGADALDASGNGVDVALIDSGITPVGDLDAPGKIVNGPDFSFDSRNPELRNLDAFGHGTHLAGIIAGVAPQARLVNVKAANAEGVTSLTQLLLAIDYTVRYRKANDLDIRVITLAVGADNERGYEREPLAWAVERAWQAGIAVVAAAGNDGSSGNGLELPAADPFVLAIGGSDTQGTADPSDDEIAEWSSLGDGTRNPDVIAPGSSIVSYRVPGSFIDQSSEGRIGDDRQRGSGTSQAAAVAAGAAALLLERHENWSPNQLKAALRETAHPLAGDPRAVGEGLLDVAAADAAEPANTRQAFRPARMFDGPMGSAYRHRMSVAVRRLKDFLGRRWTGRRWTGVKWNGVKWNGVKW
jgi:serine protease AprX